MKKDNTKRVTLTFEEWFARTFMRIEHLDKKSMMAWSWNSALEQGAGFIEDIRASVLLYPEHAQTVTDGLRNLKCLFTDKGVFRHGGLREDSPRRFLVIESGSQAVNEMVARHLAPGSPAVSRGSKTLVELPQKMMPGQKPETPAEHAQRQELITAAVRAEEVMSYDELEEHAKVIRAEKGWDIFNDPMVDRHGNVWFEIERDDEAALYADDEEPAREHFHQVLVDNRIWARNPKTEVAIAKVKAYCDAFVAALKASPAIEGEPEQDVLHPEGQPVPDADDSVSRLREALSTHEARTKVAEAMMAPLRALQEAARLVAAQEPIRAFASERGIPVFGSEAEVFEAIAGKQKLVPCPECNNSGFSGLGSGYGDVCGTCGGASRAAGGIPATSSTSGGELAAHTDRFGRVRERHIPKEVRDWLMTYVNNDVCFAQMSDEVVCEICKRAYHDHAEFAPTFHLLCGGRIGKV